MREIVEAFLHSTGVSQVSLLAYCRDLEKLLSHFSDHPEKAKREDLTDYFSRQGESLSSSSLSRQVSVVRSFYAYLQEKEIIRENPMEGISSASFAQKQAEILDNEELDRLIACPVAGFRGLRDRVMLQLLCETGLRVSELLELDVEEVQGRCILCGSGRRRRTLPVSAAVCDALSKYLALRMLYAEPKGEREPLFITAGGKRITRQGFWKNLKDRAVYSGIDKSVSPHTLRRSLALRLMEQGKAREEISGFLGNADPSSLRNYQVKTKGESNGSF